MVNVKVSWYKVFLFLRGIVIVYSNNRITLAAIHL